MGEETDSAYHVVFRSYTGALVNFYVDKASGTTRMVEYVPALDRQEEAGTMNLFEYLKQKNETDKTMDAGRAANQAGLYNVQLQHGPDDVGPDGRHPGRGGRRPLRALGHGKQPLPTARLCRLERLDAGENQAI